MYRTQLTTLSSLAKLLVRLDKPIDEVISDSLNTENSKKLSNCIKIKFLRKVLISKSIDINKRDYKKILMHPNFLAKGSEK